MTGNHKTTNGKRPAKERIEDLPFVGKGNSWKISRRGGYVGGNMAGAAGSLLVDFKRLVTFGDL